MSVETEIGSLERPWPILVLTLSGDEARREPLLSALREGSVDFELFFGVDGRSGLPSIFETTVDRDLARRKYRRPLSDGEFACALSHQQMYKTILEKGWAGAVILEDDAIMTKDAVTFVKQRLYARADMIMLDHSHARVRGPDLAFSDRIRVRRLSLPSSRTSAYSVSARAARYLLDAGTPLSDVADWPGDITTIGALACVPAIVRHQEPMNAASHLDRDRHKPASEPFRFLRPAFWRRWIIKRLSTRVPEAAGQPVSVEAESSAATRRSTRVSRPRVLSAYWNNIDQTVLASQKAVFDALGIDLVQVNTEGEHHGAWMTRMAQEAGDDIVIFCDIDAFPLKLSAYERAISVAQAGGIFGMAQVAYHLDPDMIYAAPSFLAFSKDTYAKLGKPSLGHSETVDPAQLLTVRALELGVDVELLYPGAVVKPKWPLAQRGIYGIGTFYGDNEVFHLFESRFSQHIQILNAVSEDVVAGKLDFDRYLRLSGTAQAPMRRKRFRSIRRILNRLLR
jgi:hypothetical protein